MVGEGIIFYRAYKDQRSLPLPGQLIASSALFVMLGILAESDKARPLATTLAWGFDAAALIGVLPDAVALGKKSSAKKTAKTTAGGGGGGPVRITG